MHITRLRDDRSTLCECPECHTGTSGSGVDPSMRARATKERRNFRSREQLPPLVGNLPARARRAARIHDLL